MEKTQEQKVLLATSKVADVIGLTVIGLGKTDRDLVLEDSEKRNFLVNLNSGNCYEVILLTPIKTKSSANIQDLIKEQLSYE